MIESFYNPKVESIYSLLLSVNQFSQIMKSLFTAFLLSLTFLSFGQLAPPDQIPADGGLIKIQPITHGTLMLQWNGVTIYSDPYGGVKMFEGLDNADLVLITDIHGDHHSANTLMELDLKGATFVVPKAVADVLDTVYKQTVILANGDSTSFRGVKIEALPMYNLPEDAESRHTKGRGNGYVLTIGGKRIYISGDTEDIAEMRALKNIDVAFVCMNLPYTMDINQAASAVLEFKPKVVYPFHYRGQAGLNDIEGFKKLVNAGDSAIDVRLRNWYPGN
jgi:L-ascorbate metabolism protein UlaG (beta-lactamase superfamily)